MRPITICALFFGDHLELAQRTLRSISVSLSKAGVPVVEEIRVALNDCTPRVVIWVNDWLAEQAQLHRFNVWTYKTDVNRYKYPLMRKMLRQPGPIKSPYIMWFDDDSFLEPVPGEWWQRMINEMAEADMIGQIWTMPIQGNQWEWIQAQPWCNPELSPPKKIRGKPHFSFCQGAWWMARTDVLLDCDWPVAEIRHNGGDSMLGELMRHQGLRMVRVISGNSDKHDGVRINADELGRHSKHPRRGHSEDRVGWNYEGVPLDTSHQNFDCEISGNLAPPQPPEIINLFKL